MEQKVIALSILLLISGMFALSASRKWKLKIERLKQRMNPERVFTNGEHIVILKSGTTIETAEFIRKTKIKNKDLLKAGYTFLSDL